MAQSKLWPVNTLCITIAANIAETGLLTFPACFPDSVVGFTADPKKADIRFIEYIFQAFRASVKSKAYGSVQENINLEVLRNLEFPIPSLNNQNKIADFFTLIDHRIALLRETNTTLEAIAQALFKSWFIDFDPVHANTAALENGQAPSLPAEIQALFPASFTDSPQGLIPEGWRIGNLSDELKISYGKNLPTTKLLDSGFPVFGGNGIIGFYSMYLYEQRQVLVACRGAASGKVNQSAPQSFVTNNSLVLESNETLPFGYLKGFMSLSDLSVHVTGSAQPQVTIDNLKGFKIMIPSLPIVRAYEIVSLKIEDRIAQNNKHAETLAELRDTLLPRLISGQLRLPEAEAELAAVGAN